MNQTQFAIPVLMDSKGRVQIPASIRNILKMKTDVFFTLKTDGTTILIETEAALPANQQ